MEIKKTGWTLWLTGLPCSGKTTLARALKLELEVLGEPAVVFDGDELRRTVSRDLGFSRGDREEQIRRTAELCRTAVQEGKIAVAALVSPYRGARERARARIVRFLEIFLDCPLEVCKRRDLRGLYALAVQGKVEGFTGVSDPYEPPLNPDLRLDTGRESVQDCVGKVLSTLRARHETPR